MMKCIRLLCFALCFTVITGHVRNAQKPAKHHGHKHHKPSQALRDRKRAEKEGKPIPALKRITQDAELLHDIEHIKEDLEGILSEDEIRAMSPYQLEFYYFRLHDTDNNGRLDGLEILNSLRHVEDDDDEDDSEDEFKIGKEEKETLFVEMVDNALEDLDSNHDGFLSFVEYMSDKAHASGF